jgi:hypothetical protein
MTASSPIPPSSQSTSRLSLFTRQITAHGVEEKIKRA